MSQSHVRFTSGPPKEDNAITMFSTPPHPQSQPITEHYIALQFTERHGHCIRRDAFDDGEPFLQLASVAIDNPPGSRGPYPRYEGCFRLPNSYVLGMIRELAARVEHARR